MLIIINVGGKGKYDNASGVHSSLSDKTCRSLGKVGGAWGVGGRGKFDRMIKGGGGVKWPELHATAMTWMYICHSQVIISVNKIFSN